MTALPPEDDLLLLIGDTARLIGTYADRVARRHGMTKAQWVLLLKLSRHPGLSQKDLAELMEVEPITVGRLVDRLEARGLVARDADGHDRRVWRLRLTPDAGPLLEVLAGHRADIAEMIVTGIGHPTVQTMQKGLMQVKANVVGALKGAEAPNDDTKLAVAQ
ncbi:MarR family winged helix-turn-helix transcriptional regulator [Acidisoma sp.]|uniref:MarR family winged helix-turn-helix transcriptional regulator n=1 Tax=Acidisoma sp. TaxID=1872115 RepID=UPI003B00747F